MSTSLLFYFKVEKTMNEKKYEKKIELQQKIISRQSEEIESLKSQVEDLKLECKNKDELITSVSSLKNMLVANLKDIEKYKEEYRKLIEELRKMKEVIDKNVYKGKWRLIKFLIK